MKYVLRLVYRIPRHLAIPLTTRLALTHRPAIPYILSQSRLLCTMADSAQTPRAAEAAGVDGRPVHEKAKKVKKEKKNDAASLEVIFPPPFFLSGEMRGLTLLLAHTASGVHRPSYQNLR